MSKPLARFAVLGMLSLRPMTGYEIKQVYERGPASFMSVSYGQIYPWLAKLTREKLIRKDKATGGRRSLRYHITRAGTEALRAWMFAPMHSEDSGMNYRELLLRTFFVPAEELSRLQEAFEVFEEAQRAEMRRYESTRDWLHSDRGTHPRLGVWLLVLDYGVKKTTASLDWIAYAKTKADESKKERTT